MSWVRPDRISLPMIRTQAVTALWVICLPLWFVDGSATGPLARDLPRAPAMRFDTAKAKLTTAGPHASQSVKGKTASQNRAALQNTITA